MDITVIETPDKVFASKVSNDLYDSYDRYTSLDGYLVNGEAVKNTGHHKWSEISGVPEKVQRWKSSPRTNSRWELRMEFVDQKLLPEVIYCDSKTQDAPAEGTEALYELKYEQEPDYLEDVEFSLTFIEGPETFEPREVHERVGRVSLLDSITVPKILHTERPMKLSSVESYSAIRKGLNERIDRKIASLMDYDFCLTVRKAIPLSEPEPYQKDISRIGARKPKYVTDYRKVRTIDVFECAPFLRGEVYRGHTRCVEFSGSSYDDLQKNINAYLDDLIKHINEPLKDCSHCRGTGVESAGVINGK